MNGFDGCNSWHNETGSWEFDDGVLRPSDDMSIVGQDRACPKGLDSPINIQPFGELRIVSSSPTAITISITDDSGAEQLFTGPCPRTKCYGS